MGPGVEDSGAAVSGKNRGRAPLGCTAEPKLDGKRQYGPISIVFRAIDSPRSDDGVVKELLDRSDEQATDRHVEIPELVIVAPLPALGPEVPNGLRAATDLANRAQSVEVTRRSKLVAVQFQI
jgi:hypothetical protein